MVVRVAFLVTFLALSSVPMALAQGPSVGDGVERDAVTSVVEAPPAIPQLSFEMPPRVVVYSGEEIVLYTDVPHDSGYEPSIPNIPYVEWLEYGEVFVSNWTAYGGRLLSVGEEALVYRAPNEPGIACLVWNNGVDEPIMPMVIVPGEGESWDTQVELPIESLRGNDGCYLPCAGGTSFRLFAVAPTQLQPGSRPPGAGFAYVPSNNQLNPPPDDLDCTGTGLRAVATVKNLLASAGNAVRGRLSGHCAGRR